MFMEFQFGGLIVIVICVLDFIRSNSALHPHQSEQEALIKFMEDLEKIVPNDCAKKGDIFMKLLFSEGDSKRY